MENKEWTKTFTGKAIATLANAAAVGAAVCFVGSMLLFSYKNAPHPPVDKKKK